MAITPQERQQIINNKDFADKFNELTNGWKPKCKMPDTCENIRNEYLAVTPYLQTGMDKATYKEFMTTRPDLMEWGMQHKLCVFTLNRQQEIKKVIHCIECNGSGIRYAMNCEKCSGSGFINIKGELEIGYFALIEPYIDLYNEINAFVAEKTEQAIKEVHSLWKVRQTLAGSNSNGLISKIK